MSNWTVCSEYTDKDYEKKQELWKEKEKNKKVKTCCVIGNVICAESPQKKKKL